MSHSIRVARASCASLWSTVSLARRSTALGQRQITYLGAVTGVPASGAFSRATTHDGMVYVSGTGGANDTGKDMCLSQCIGVTRLFLKDGMKQYDPQH